MSNFQILIPNNRNTKLLTAYLLQVEMNPRWHQKKLREFCKANDIHITAYTPLGANGTKWGDNRIIDCDVLGDIAKAKGKTTAQVCILFFPRL